MLHGEGAEKTDLDKAGFFSAGIQVMNSLFDDFTGRSHADDNAVGMGIAHIIKEMIGAAGNALNPLHVFFNNFRNSVIEAIAGFYALEINIGILGGAPNVRMFRIHGN